MGAIVTQIKTHHLEILKNRQVLRVQKEIDKLSKKLEQYQTAQQNIQSLMGLRHNISAQEQSIISYSVALKQKKPINKLNALLQKYHLSFLSSSTIDQILTTTDELEDNISKFENKLHIRDSVDKCALLLAQKIAIDTECMRLAAILGDIKSCSVYIKNVSLEIKATKKELGKINVCPLCRQKVAGGLK